MKQANLTFTNRDYAQSRNIQLYDTGDLDNYGPQANAGQTRYLNGTAATDATEKFVLYCGDRKKVETNCEVVAPSRRRLAASDENQKIMEGIQWGCYTDVIVQVTDTDDPTYLVTYPMRCKIEFENENLDLISDAITGEILGRTISHFQDADGTWRFKKLRGRVTQVSNN